MEVVATAVVGRIFFGVYKIQEPLQSPAPFPSRTNQVTPYTMGKSEGQRKRRQMRSGVVLGTEGGGGAAIFGGGREFRNVWRPTST